MASGSYCHLVDKCIKRRKRGREYGSMGAMKVDMRNQDLLVTRDPATLMTLESI